MSHVHWLFDKSGDFDDPTRWSGGGGGAPSDNVTIATKGRFGYGINVVENETVKNLTLVNDVSHTHTYPVVFYIKSAIFQAGTISNGATIFLSYGSTVSAGGNIINSGVIQTETNTTGTELIEAKNIVNTGYIVAADFDVLAIDANVTGKDGMIAIYNDTVICKGAVNSDILFDDTEKFASQIELAKSASYSKTISGFGTVAQDSLDLDDIGFVGSGEATFSGTKAHGILTVTDGAHTAELHLNGDYLGMTFTASSDGHGGTIVVPNAQAPARSTHTFVSAMASLGTPPAHLAHAGEAWAGGQPLLSGPRVATA